MKHRLQNTICTSSRRAITMTHCHFDAIVTFAPQTLSLFALRRVALVTFVTPGRRIGIVRRFGAIEFRRIGNEPFNGLHWRFYATCIDKRLRYSLQIFDITYEWMSQGRWIKKNNSQEKMRKSCSVIQLDYFLHISENVNNKDITAD
jgi:hypothetical protein